MHNVCEFYKKIYLLSAKIPKRDRFGIYAKIETICLDIVALSITAALEIKPNKIVPLNSARIKIEALKRLIRIASELNIINSKRYLELELELQEISKMANGWLKYAKENPR